MTSPFPLRNKVQSCTATAFAPSKGHGSLRPQALINYWVNKGVIVQIRRVQKTSVDGFRRGCSQPLPLRAVPNTSWKLGKGDILKGSKGEGSIVGSSSLVPSRVFMGMPRSRQRDSWILSFKAPGAPCSHLHRHRHTRSCSGPPEPLSFPNSP